MIAVVQRVQKASVSVDGEVVARVGRGLVALVGVARGDGERDVEYTARRLLTLRVLEDDEGRMNLSVGDVGGGLLLVSQFTLLADTRKGRRPSFTRAADPEEAAPLFARLADTLREGGADVGTGVFGAKMTVDLVNDGPVTLILDSRHTRRGEHRDGG